MGEQTERGTPYTQITGAITGMVDSFRCNFPQEPVPVRGQIFALRHDLKVQFTNKAGIVVKEEGEVRLSNQRHKAILCYFYSSARMGVVHVRISLNFCLTF